MSNLYRIKMCTAQLNSCKFAITHYADHDLIAKRAYQRILIQNNSLHKDYSGFSLTDTEIHALIQALDCVVRANEVPNTQIYRDTIVQLRCSLQMDLIPNINPDDQLGIMLEKTGKILFLSPDGHLIAKALTGLFRKKLGAMMVFHYVDGVPQAHAIPDVQWLCMFQTAMFQTAMFQPTENA